MADFLTLPMIKDLAPHGGIGSVSKAQIDSLWLYNRHMTTGVHILTYDDSSGAGSYVDVTTAAQDDTPNDVALLPVSPSVDDAFLTLFPTTRSISGHDIRVSVAGSDITWAVEYWNGVTNTWTAVSNLVVTHTSGGAEVAVDLLESADLQFIKFDEPEDMGVFPVTIGGEDITGKAVRFRVASVGGAPTAPRASQVFPLDVTASGTNITPIAASHSHPDVFSYGNDENAFYITSENKFYAYEYLLWKIAVSDVSATIKHQFWNGTSWVDAPYFATCATAGSEETTVNKVANTQTVTPREFTATLAGGSAISTEKILTDGLISAVTDAVQGASSDRAGMGLSRTSTGDIEFEMRKDFTGGNPRIVIYESGSAVYTHTSNTLATDELSVMAYQAAGDSARKIVYFINKIQVYTSTETIAESDTFYGRIVSVDNGATFTEIRMVNMGSILGQNIDPTLTGTNATIANAAPVSEEVVQKQIIIFQYSDAWIAHTALTSPTGTAGYTMRQFIEDKEGELTGSVVSSGGIYPVTASAIGGIIIDETDTFDRYTITADSELNNNLTYFVINVATGTLYPVTLSAGSTLSNAAQTITLPSSTSEFAVIQASVQEQDDAFINIMLSK